MLHMCAAYVCIDVDFGGMHFSLIGPSTWNVESYIMFAAPEQRICSLQTS